LYTLKFCYNIEGCGDDVDDTTEENSSVFSLVKVKLAGWSLTQVDPYNHRKNDCVHLKKIDYYQSYSSDLNIILYCVAQLMVMLFMFRV